MQEPSNLIYFPGSPILSPQKLIKTDNRNFPKKNQPLSTYPPNNIEHISTVLQNFFKSHDIKFTPTDKKIKILPAFINQSSASHLFLIFKDNSIHVFVTITPSFIYISIKSTMIKLNSLINTISPQINQINSSFLKFSLHYAPPTLESDHPSKSYENWNILLVSRFMHFYYYYDIEVIKYCWKTIKEGVDILYENIQILKNINKPLLFRNFWDQNKIKQKEAHEILKKGVSMLEFKNIKENKRDGFVFLISVCDDHGGLEAWSTFPLIFETKAEIIEARLFFAINQRIVTFLSTDYKAIIEFLSLTNSYINFGTFVWDSRKNQVFLKMTFYYAGYSKENLLNLPKEIFSNISTYKKYAKGLNQIYSKGNPASPIEIFYYCQGGSSTNQLDEDSNLFKSPDEIKTHKTIVLQLKRKNYYKEKKIFAIISSREYLKEIFQADHVIFLDENQEIKYEFIEGKDLPRAIPHIKLPDIFEEFANEMHKASLTFQKSPLEFLTVIERKLKFCYKGASLQTIVQRDKNKTDYYDFMKTCFDYLEIYLCKILNKK
ncbi:unnamed protein product [Blepharisma stoltei]|uniref:Uncharacterized protein n=1 Tax=Blepharisma stoltei TaxID=1481888 RepID=A0AAU9JUC8_9CILI|nr:unnamed protein product [Blepharisma stoltei]